MHKQTILLAGSVLISAFVINQAAGTPGEVRQVVRAVKAANPDFRTLCQSGSDKIRAEVTKATVKLATSGAIASNPRKIGEAAGKQVVAECKS